MDKVQLEPRFFKGVLQTLINIDFHGNVSVTLEDLGAQLMATVATLTEADFGALVDSCRLVLKSAAHEYWPVEQLEQFLTKQATPPELVETFLVVWRGEREKVHEIMRQKSSFADGMENFSWRVDVKSSARHVEQINEPTAILEFAVRGGGGAAAGGGGTTIRCEADREMVTSVLESIDAIKAKIDQLQA